MESLQAAGRFVPKVWRLLQLAGRFVPKVWRLSQVGGRFKMYFVS
jgi:hypothetical protein